MKKYPVELTEVQLERLGLKVPKFELSKEFWKGRETHNVNEFGEIFRENGFFRDMNEPEYSTELPTNPHAESYKVWARLMMIQYEMNDGEVLDEGYSVYMNNGGISVSGTYVVHGIKFKTRILAKQFLEENREDLEKIKIMGF